MVLLVAIVLDSLWKESSITLGTSRIVRKGSTTAGEDTSSRPIYGSTLTAYREAKTKKL